MKLLSMRAAICGIIASSVAVAISAAEGASGFKDNFSIQSSLDAMRVRDGEAAAGVGVVVQKLIDTIRAENAGRSVSLLLVGDMDLTQKVRVNWSDGAAGNALAKVCKDLGWEVAFTEHVAIAGPSNAVRKFRLAWAKKPDSLPGRTWRINRVSFSESTFGEACDFLNAKQREMAANPILKFTMNEAVKEKIWFDGENVPIPDIAWLLSASVGLTPDEAFGLKF